MELDKELLNDSWNKMVALENETKLLLEIVRGKPKANKVQNQDQKPKKKEQSGHKRRKPEMGPLSRVTQPDSRVTIEVLDDASPDATPRISEDLERNKKMSFEKNKLLTMRMSEQHFRKLQFQDEKSRLQHGADTFVRRPGITVDDIAKEKQRLAKLEESARQKIATQRAEERGQKLYLHRDKVALKLQSVFRGHIGRQRFALAKAIKTLQDDEEDGYGDWIEANDEISGKIWYYNKVTGESQWNKPDLKRKVERDGLKSSGSERLLPRLSDSNNNSNSGTPTRPYTNNYDRRSQSRKHTNTTASTIAMTKTLPVSMSLPSLDAMKMSKMLSNNNSSHSSFNDTNNNIINNNNSSNGLYYNQRGSSSKQLTLKEASESHEYEARRAVTAMLGIDQLAPAGGLMAPDGTFKPQLRTVVQDALLDTRFDSVSTVLGDPRWYEDDEQPLEANKLLKRKQILASIHGSSSVKGGKEDISRLPLVSEITFNKKKTKRGKTVSASDTVSGGVDDDDAARLITDPKDLTFNQIQHTGFEETLQQHNAASSEIMCFGCWSAGVLRTCELHDSGAPLKPSQTMLLCRNWELDVMRRRYRSEEIQELFLQKESSLRFDTKHKKFSTVTEQRHPVYRTRNQVNESFNARMVLFEKVKRWLLSMGEQLRMGKAAPDHSEGASAASELQMRLRAKRNYAHYCKLDRFTQTYLGLLPVAPITGYSWPERQGIMKYLYKHTDASLGQEVDLMLCYPIPIPKQLYIPREYHLPLPLSIPMPAPSYTGENPSVRILPSNTYIPDAHDAAWLERICAVVVRDAIQSAKEQIKQFTPVTQTELLARTAQPPPSTIKSATIGRKPAPDNNKAVGGLPLELLVHQLICTFIPTQYGNFMVMDKASVSPGISPEVNIVFQSIVMAPIVQHHVIRPLEHPLNYRRAPTITLNSSASPDDKHYYGLNRPEQTGEQAYHGFRTTAWAPRLLTYVETDPQVFVPGQGVVSLNQSKANVSVTTHADYTYPFCEPSTRDNSTLDFYHLLLQGVVSAARAQVFTALTVQEPGHFLKAYDDRAPMGNLVVSVYRSWAFTQKDTIEEFRTDDGISYWYHRKTGQTFWERPLYEEEEESPLLGGTLLDYEHAEEPLAMTNGSEGSQRRYTQGEFRTQMLSHIETKGDAMNRRKAAAATVKNARERGVIPELVGLTSIMNHMHSSAEMGSHFDFSKRSDSSGVGTTNPSTADTNRLRDNSNNVVAPTTAANYNNITDAQQYDTDVNNMNQMMLMQESHTVDGPYLNQQQRLNQHTAAAAGDSGKQQQQQYVRGSRLEEGSHQFSDDNNGNTNGVVPLPTIGNGSQQQQQQQQQNNSFNVNNNNNTLLNGNFPGIDPNVVSNLSNMIGQMVSNMMNMTGGDGSNAISNPQNMVQLGLGMGMALMTTGVMQNVVAQQQQQQQQFGGNNNNNNSYINNAPDGGQPQNQIQRNQLMQSSLEIEEGGGVFPTIGEEESSEIASSVLDYFPQQQQQQQQQSPKISAGGNAGFISKVKQQPIGLPYASDILSADKKLDHGEEEAQRLQYAERMNQPMSTLEVARNLRMDGTASQTPDMMPPKILTHQKPLNAECAIREQETLPLLAYPELSSLPPNGPPVPYATRQPAGLGTSFVTKSDAVNQRMVPGAAANNLLLRRTAMPLPAGFFEAIEAKHVAQQATDYLPQVPNLPQSRNIGRVKPRSAAADWLMISFDPWSAGKNPLGTEYISSLMDKADKFVEGGANKAATVIDQMRQNALGSAFVNVQDDEGLAQQRAEITKADHLAQDFKKLCSMCRHSKFSDAEQLINQPDWSVPIDYQDEQGNTLLHVVAQNGSKRLVKLCMRRGASLDLQNLTGQTALHFSYGYGYVELGDYIRSKGANDAIRNKDGLTCYEGLGARELEYL